MSDPKMMDGALDLLTALPGRVAHLCDGESDVQVGELMARMMRDVGIHCASGDTLGLLEAWGCLLLAMVEYRRRKEDAEQ